MVVPSQGSDTSFPPCLRIRRSREFGRVRREGKRLTTRHFIIYYLNTDSEGRLGLTVSRKVGGAVQRNRVKRLVREFYRLHRQLLPPHTDFSIIAKVGAADLDFDGLRRELMVLSENPARARTLP